jgi:hypothetical protein
VFFMQELAKNWRLERLGFWRFPNIWEAKVRFYTKNWFGFSSFSKPSPGMGAHTRGSRNHGYL